MSAHGNYMAIWLAFRNGDFVSIYDTTQGVKPGSAALDHPASMEQKYSERGSTHGMATWRFAPICQALNVTQYAGSPQRGCHVVVMFLQFVFCHMAMHQPQEHSLVIHRIFA